MSRIRSVTPSVPGINRRTVLAAAGAVSLSAGGVGWALHSATSAEADPAVVPAGQAGQAGDSAGTRAEARAAAGAAPAPLAPYTLGTTLSTVAAPDGPGQGSGYRRLGEGRGWRRVVRGELATPNAGRESRRTALAAFVQLTDLHIVDTQHPLRLEFLRSGNLANWRPHDVLSLQGTVSLVERVNSLRAGPVTGAPLRFAITTGDNTDNNARTELDWFLTAFSGGRINPDTGDPDQYEGVLNSGLAGYWQPDSVFRDDDKRRGFPHIEGFLRAATREFTSPGLRLPWYSTVGNHDSLPLGAFASHDDSFLTEFAVGGRKLMSLPEDEANVLRRSNSKATGPKGQVLAEVLRAHRRDLRPVTPDERRAPFGPSEYIEAHLDAAYTGSGPAGHGYTADNLAAGTQYYTFRVSDDVVGVSLDTTDPGGHFDGSIGTAQLRWLDRVLREHRDEYVIVFSHHTSRTMGNTRRDPGRPGERRHTGREVVDLLASHPNVVAWVNGHIHRNSITAHRTPGGRSFWEISTASHVDHPQLARVVELVDNGDGTLSLFTTLVESAAPHRTDFTDLGPVGLASLYRELGFNAPGTSMARAGDPEDRNTELVLKKP